MTGDMQHHIDRYDAYKYNWSAHTAGKRYGKRFQ